LVYYKEVELEETVVVGAHDVFDFLFAKLIETQTITALP
tara:strand:- start:218 stop:334 length:117 start_codon:yes stop_codon:yes gene_type:complete